jgi:hypothetical protein
MAPIEPRPVRRWASRGYRLLEAVLPIAASWLARRHFRPPSGKELAAWIAENEALLTQSPEVADEIDDLVDANFERSTSLEAKAVAILQGVAILGAILVGVQAVVWDWISSLQKACFIASDFYGALALFQAIYASRPKVIYVYTESEIKDQASRSLGRSHSAARRLAYVQANRAVQGRLSNDVEASLGSLRNALVLALVSALPVAVQWVVSVWP